MQVTRYQVKADPENQKDPEITGRLPAALVVVDGPGQAGELFAATDGEPRAWPSHQQQPAAPGGDLGEKLGLLSVEAAQLRR